MTTATTHSDTPASGNLDSWVFRIAGIIILTSLLLTFFYSNYWLWLNAFVGANMLQASFTGFCPLANLLRKMGIQSGAAFSCSGGNT